ncbi:glucose-6-phosphate dehydrogenase [Microlunatus flavus]|uniref:Glucose-6-phosphate 1-dehydrogenase n=1 Tax=Microlunatus flavus TaxID=1036181 RepID=A0A1H8ZEM0_9ACTN|nr:glucose-6-phosphate dehydrogenase [Microlunatus flavus]SEP62899.1 glucose-6-phosphate 1-dehydrogenase [Microlunatus flavus]
MSISSATPDQAMSVHGAPLPDTPIRTLVLLGASGDLAHRLLMPALGKLLDAEPQRRDLVLVGAGAEDWDAAAWHDRLEDSLTKGDVSRETIDALLATTSYQRADVTKADDLRRLVQAGEAAPALYFALPPAVTAKACDALVDVELPEGTVLVLEKPFGTDEASAKALNARLAGLVPEDRTFRVDHFLGRATVLNLLGVRFANRIFEPVWNAGHVASVDIVFDEPLTLEGRAGYYDKAGALVDMIQSHLLQVMALVAMDPVGSVSAFDLRESKAEVLRATRVWGGDAALASRRARYSAGSIGGREVPDYVHEPGVDPARNTETLAEVTLEIDNWRWAGVPFRLRSGKSVGTQRKEVVVTFKPVPHLPTGLTGTCEPDRLRLVMGPDAIALDLNVNGEDDPMGIDHVTLDTELSPGRLPAYGEVLAGVLDGDPLLAVRGDTAVECWRIVDSVLKAWAADETPMETYAAGTQGPEGWPV